MEISRAVRESIGDVKHRAKRKHTWEDEHASERQIEYIRAIQAAARRMGKYLPFVPYWSVTKGEASRYIKRYAEII